MKSLGIKRYIVVQLISILLLIFTGMQPYIDKSINIYLYLIKCYNNVLYIQNTEKSMAVE